MRLIKTLIILLLLTTASYADVVIMPQYGPKDTLTNVNLNLRWNLLRDELNSHLNNQNADTDNGFRFYEILSSLPANGNQGRVVFLTADDTLNHDTGTVWKTTGILGNDQIWTGFNTFTGNSTFAGTTIVDLGSVTTADINGGTLDGVQIGGTTATGELFINNSSDGAEGLGSQGTIQQFLQSSGVGASPSWVTFTTVEVFTTPGNNTFTTPVGVDSVGVILVGGGGGGESDGAPGGGGGGGGETVYGIFKTVPTTGYTAFVGSSGAVDANGTASTFDGKFSAAGGTAGAAASGGVGGTSSGADRDGADGTSPPAAAGLQSALLRLAGGDGGSEAGNNGGGGGGTGIGTGATGGTNSGAGAGTAPANGGGGGGGGGANPGAASPGADGKVMIFY